MTKVYLWPACLGGETLYSDPNRFRMTRRWDGAPGQKVEQAQRSRVTLAGEVVRALAPDFDIMMDRLRGGEHFVGLWDMEWRKQNGWDGHAALNASGAEFWRADGIVENYAGESANPPTGPWRSVYAAANGAASYGATSLAIDGLLDSEVIPKGAMIRIADYRYRTLTAATANASGEATLSLASPLRAVVADNDSVRVPGDLFVGHLLSPVDVSPADVDGLRTFTAQFIEVYESELDSTISPSEFFEWVVD